MLLCQEYAISDIPSHIMREPEGIANTVADKRYTLTYNEGTVEELQADRKWQIYPHI